MEQLTKFVESLAINPWIVVLFGSCTVVSTFLAIIFYLRSKKDKLPRYAIRSNNLIQGTKEKIPSLKIHFEGHGDDIGNLTVSKLALWNAGRETIKKQDVVNRELTLHVKEDCKILDATVFRHTTDENKFAVSKAQDKKSATITFEYIDRNEGAIFQIFHTGLGDKDLCLKGKIMGAGEPVKMFIPHSDLAPQKSPPKYSRPKRIVQGILLIVLPFVLTGLIWIASYFPGPQVEEIRPKLEPMTGTQLAIILCALYGTAWFTAYLVLKPRIPKGLDLFYEDF